MLVILKMWRSMLYEFHFFELNYYACENVNPFNDGLYGFKKQMFCWKLPAKFLNLQGEKVPLCKRNDKSIKYWSKFTFSLLSLVWNFLFFFLFFVIVCLYWISRFLLIRSCEQFSIHSVWPSKNVNNLTFTCSFLFHR